MSSESLSITDQIVALIDQWYLLNQERLELQRQADALEEKEKKLKAEASTLMKQHSVLKIKGSLCDVEIEEGATVPTPRNWELIYKYIQENGAFDLLQRRLSETAVRARWDEGEDHLPGIDKYPVTKFKVTNKRPV